MATVRVRNALQADGGDAEVNEDVPTTLTLHGHDAARSLSYVIGALPIHGSLYQCVDEGGDCCVERRCLDGGTRLHAAGERLRDGGGRLVYSPAADYFNCWGSGACTDGAAAGRPYEAVSYRIEDDAGESSDNATLRVWVRNSNDLPWLEGPLSMSAVVRQLTYLAPLSIRDPDGDVARWEVEVSVDHGFLSLNQSALPPRFLLGDGASDALMRFEATPSQANAALDGARFISLRPENATVRVRVADPIGTEMRELGMMTVVMEAGTGGGGGGASGDGEITQAVVALWSAIALGTLLVWFRCLLDGDVVPAERGGGEGGGASYHELIEEEEEKEREAARREAAEAPPSARVDERQERDHFAPPLGAHAEAAASARPRDAAAEGPGAAAGTGGRLHCCRLRRRRRRDQPWVGTLGRR